MWAASCGVIEQNLQLFEIGLPAPFAQLVADEHGGLVVSGRAGDVRLGGQGAEPAPRVLGRRHRERFRLGFELPAAVLGREAQRMTSVPPNPRRDRRLAACGSPPWDASRSQRQRAMKSPAHGQGMHQTRLIDRPFSGNSYLTDAFSEGDTQG